MRWTLLTESFFFDNCHSIWLIWNQKNTSTNVNVYFLRWVSWVSHEYPMTYTKNIRMNVQSSIIFLIFWFLTQPPLEVILIWSSRQTKRKCNTPWMQIANSQSKERFLYITTTSWNVFFRQVLQNGSCLYFYFHHWNPNLLWATWNAC